MNTRASTTTSGAEQALMVDDEAVASGGAVVPPEFGDAVRPKKQKTESPVVVFPSDRRAGFTHHEFAYKDVDDRVPYDAEKTCLTSNAIFTFYFKDWSVFGDGLHRLESRLLDVVYLGDDLLRLESATFPYTELQLGVPTKGLTLGGLKAGLGAFLQLLDNDLRARGDPPMEVCNVLGFAHKPYTSPSTFKVIVNDHHKDPDAIQVPIGIGFGSGMQAYANASLPALFLKAEYERRLPDEHDHMGRAHLERLLAALETGDEIYLTNIERRPALNDSRARVVKYDVDQDRYQVRIGSWGQTEVISVKASSVRKAGFRFCPHVNVRHDAATGKDVCTVDVDVRDDTPVRRVVKDGTGTVPDDEILFYGPHLLLSLANEGDPAPDMDLAKVVRFDLPTGELTVGDFCERIAATEPDRRIAYGASATASSFLSGVRDCGGKYMHYATRWMYDELADGDAREGAA
jgi:hypothetical protein